MRERDDTTTVAAGVGTLLAVQRALLDWFDTTARDLPWRRGPDARDPFHVLVAEVVLQQTQASRAGPAYERLLRRFPDAERLANADTDEVLEAWSGLGYYQRALRLQRCARLLVEQHGGRVPSDLTALRALPGIGRYGAHAIAARAFGAPHIAVDANVRRVGARVLDLVAPDDVVIEEGLARLLFTGGPRDGDVSEALIELGARACRPRLPRCAACPLADACRAHRAGRAEAVPAPRRRTAPRRERLPLLVALRGREAALLRRPSRGRWAGLWGFPTGDAPGEALPGFLHQLTHRTLEVEPRLVTPDALDATPVWVPLERVAGGGDAHPVAAVDQRVARLVLATTEVADGHAPPPPTTSGARS